MVLLLSAWAISGAGRGVATRRVPCTIAVCGAAAGGGGLHQKKGGAK